ncbi:ankyrin repeat-containing domain protein, partial [Xylaria flabelliformis]
MASLLLSQGLDINKVTSAGYNALHAACAIGTVEAVKWLLDRNADINAKSSRYGTALCAAIESTTSIQDKILLLLEHRRNPEINLSNEDDPTPLQRAVSKGEVSVVKLLVEHKADVNITRPGCDTPLNEAITHRFIPLEIIDMLLKKGADIHKPGVKGMLPIHIAANSDRLDVVELLYSKGANAYARDNNDLTPLMYGLLNNSVEVVKFLLS